MKVFLQERFFTDKETTFLECGEFKASLFTYSTGIKAVRLSNAKGSIVVLPWMGQMVSSALTAATNRSTSIGGMHSLLLEFCIRFAFMSGRKRLMPP